jgi:hypothetical protein
MNQRVLWLILLTATSIAACRSSDRKVSFSDVEKSRTQARANVSHLAETWQKANGFELYKLDVRDDPTIGPDCPQGDGWAEVAVVDKTTQQTVRLLKCSTTTASLGCMTAGTFDGTPHQREEGTCNKGIPLPLPKVE